jgi:hypothetical protein
MKRRDAETRSRACGDEGNEDVVLAKLCVRRFISAGKNVIFISASLRLCVERIASEELGHDGRA